MTSQLAAFHPQIRAWFEATFRTPTDVQVKSWPLIAAGRHVLITAPTGSGKTLTAFLWALDAFATRRYSTGATRVLYISPLKALNNDIQRNLLQPLGELQARFVSAGADFPSLGVQVRSGDTAPGERQRMLRRPPEILITTPESLLLLLTTARGRQALATIQTVILDEIHAVVDNRRGTVLMTCLERLVHIAGDVQRIALSATVHPLKEIAAFVAGRDGQHRPRSIDIVVGTDPKKIEFKVRFPDHVRAAQSAGEKIWAPLTQSFKRIIAANASTLFFTNSRRLAEKITLKINDAEADPLAYAHHGSLSRDIRTEVEARLKSGAMRAIVATNSLEMGIDIGSIDEVVLIQSPPSITSALQRIGRAGHRVGDTSRGTLFPTHAHDFLEAAALAECIEARELEPLTPIENALDVLAQIIVSMTATETWQIDTLYDVLRQSYPYRSLPRDQFELVVEMLAGRYAGSRVRDLKARIVYDRIDHSLRATKGAVYALYNSGGTIPDRGYYHLRHSESFALIGDLDEEFVWEALVGQTFSFGSQHWQIKRITHNDVLAAPAPANASPPPFWKAEGYNRSFFYSMRIGEYLEGADALLESADHVAFRFDLTTRHGFDAAAAMELDDYLSRQREHTGASLPHRRHLLIEHIHTGAGGYRGPDQEQQIVLHTGWGGRVNRPYALILAIAWERTYGEVPEMFVDNNAVAIQTKVEVDPARVVDLVNVGDVDSLLHAALARSGFFGARFRECAGRALLVTRQRFNQRMPLWMSRLHAKKLMTTVMQYADFPILLEAYRTCLVDEFDLPALRSVLEEIASGEIAVTNVATPAPSPFATNIAWGQISRYMYADDTPESTTGGALSDDLIRAAVFDADLRPRLDAAVVAGFVAKRQRTAPGYAPVDAVDLGEWLKERILIAEADWLSLSAGVSESESIETHWVTHADRRWVVHLELARIVTECLLGRVDDQLADVGDARDATQLVQEFLSFYGPLPRAVVGALIPLTASELDRVLADLVEAGVMVSGPLIAGDDTHHYCDADNLEILLRVQRAARRHPLEPRPIVDLPGFVASWQHFGSSASTTTLSATLDRLRGYPAAVEVWLNDLVEARHRGVDTRQLDEVLSVDDLAWVGRGPEVITVMPKEDLVLLEPVLPAAPALAGAFKDQHARYGFFQLTDATTQSTAAFSDMLWEAVWAGTISTDSFAALRAGNLRQYRMDSLPSTQPAQRHRSGARRRARSESQGWPGNWFLLPDRSEALDVDPLNALEAAKDRVRILLDRYGVISRELANREGGPFRWASLFRALRIMELSGEIAAGLFFNGLSGPQFAAPAAVRQLERGNGVESFWVNATDPAAPTGLGLDWPALALPQRRPSNYLAFHRGRLVLVAENYGRRLSVAADLDAEAFGSVAALLTHLLTRRRKITIDSIDGGAPSASPLLVRLADVFDVARDHRGVDLMFPLQRRDQTYVNQP